MARTATQLVSVSGVDSISSKSSSFVLCSVESVKDLIFDDEMVKQVGPGGIFLKSSREVVNRQKEGSGLNEELGIGSKVGPDGLFIKSSRDVETRQQEDIGLIKEIGIGSKKGDGQILTKSAIPINSGSGNKGSHQLCRQDETKEADGLMEDNLVKFDVQCSKLKNSKKIRKKMRDVFELREKVEKCIYLVEHCTLPRLDRSKKKPSSFSKVPKNPLILDLPLSNDSLTHSEVRNCNYRIEKGGIGNMSVGI